MLSVECERLEKVALDGGSLDTPLYAVMVGHLARTLSLLGLKRVPKDITPLTLDTSRRGGSRTRPSRSSQNPISLTSFDVKRSLQVARGRSQLGGFQPFEKRALQTAKVVPIR
jgi:hypothetical protein